MRWLAATSVSSRFFVTWPGYRAKPGCTQRAGAILALLLLAGCTAQIAKPTIVCPAPPIIHWYAEQGGPGVCMSVEDNNKLSRWWTVDSICREAAMK